MSNKVATFWLFPADDFEAWCELVGSPQVETYEGYEWLIGEATAEAVEAGCEVAICHMTVADMRERLKEGGFANTAAGRAAALSGIDQRPTTLAFWIGGPAGTGLDLKHHVVASAWVDSGVGGMTVPVSGPQDVRAAIREAIKQTK